MGRGITVDVGAALQGSNVPLVVFIEMQLADETLRFCNATHTMQWDGHDWIGAGAVSGIEPISESEQPTASSVMVMFTGIDPDYVAAIRTQHYQGRPARVWVAPLSAAYVPINNPVLVFVGRMDEPEITLGETASIAIRLETRWADFDRPRIRRYSHADQQAYSPGDRFCEYVDRMEGVTFVWGTIRGPDRPKQPKWLRETMRVVNQVGDFLGDLFRW